MDDATTVSLSSREGAPPAAPSPVDPLFAAMAAHRPRLTRQIVRYATGMDAFRWRNLRQGRVNWTHAELRALGPLLGETPAALADLLERSGRYVRPDEKRKSPRRTCPKPHVPRKHPHSHSPARPSDAAPDCAA